MRLFVVLTLFLAACAGCGTRPVPVETSQSGTPWIPVTGRAYYLERIAIPSDCRLTVRVVDVSKADAMAEVIAEAIVETKGGQGSFPFTVLVDGTRIFESRRYTLEAVLEHNDRVLMRTTEHHPVLTQSGGTAVDVRLVMIGGGAPAQ